MKKSDLKRAKHENLLRLARSLKLHDIDEMSHRQLVALVWWLLTRHEKKARGMTWDP